MASVLGFGGSEIGYERAGARTVARLLGTALDAGLNVIDTAECYEDSEALIGSALGARRNEIYLLTKCGHPRGYGRGDWREASLLSSIERSLKRLRTDRLDLIQLHSCELADLRKGEAITALERARERGYARYIGYSGDGEAARYAVECGRFDTLQTSVSIADQEALELTLPLAVKRRMGVIAKRPIANAAWRYARRPAEPYYQPYWERLRALEYPFLRDAPSTWCPPRCASPWPRRACTPRSSGPSGRSAGRRTRACSRRGRCPPRRSSRSAPAGERSPSPPGPARSDPRAGARPPFERRLRRRNPGCRGRSRRGPSRPPPTNLSGSA